MALIGLNPEYKKFEYSGIEIHQWLQEHKNPDGEIEKQITYGCLYGDDLIVLGSGLPAFKQAIDVLEGSAPGTASDIFNDDLLDNAFFQVAAEDMAQTIGDKSNAALLRLTEKLVIAVGEAEDKIFSTVNLTAKSEKTTEYIKMMINGVIAYMILAGEEEPEMAELAQMIQLSSSGNTIQIRLELEPEFIQQSISKSVDNKGK
jgi:hypothetical protein